MGMNDTPRGERVHIAFFGRRNAGKSSLVNAVTGQELAVVSEVKGTTTDPVYKSMELLPLGPVVIIDTPGFDDEGELGEKRVEKACQILNKTDIAVLVVDAAAGPGPWEEKLTRLFKEKEVPWLAVLNKSDLLSPGNCPPGAALPEPATSGRISGTGTDAGASASAPGYLRVSAATGQGIEELKERLARMAPEEKTRYLVADLVKPSDLAVLVVPIDKAAPRGRLILPQQQVIRELLDCGAGAVVCRETELEGTLKALREDPALVITDSQVFPLVDQLTPRRIRLTSFSILFARYKGNLAQAVQGARALESIKDGSRILMAEGCTHHRQCGDIGTVKLPGMIRAYTGCQPEFVFTSGTEFPRDLSDLDLAVHCGGCMLNEREMKNRLKSAKAQGIPMTNYGIAIAYMKGILQRSIEFLGEEM